MLPFLLNTCTLPTMAPENSICEREYMHGKAPKRYKNVRKTF